MTRPLIVFLESYVAGGADRVVANLIAKLPVERVDLFVNSRCDFAVLFAAPLPSHVRVQYYAWTTIAEWSRWAMEPHSGLVRQLRRFAAVAARYPWLVVLLLRCYWRFRRVGPCAVWINNGGYPGGDVCRVATIAAGWLENCAVVHLVHSPAQTARRALQIPEWVLDRWLDRSARFVAVSRAVAESLREKRAIHQPPLVIYNGLPFRDPVSVPSVSRSLRLLQVGYFDRNKNQAMSIRALGLLRRAGISSVHLTLVGKEAESGQLAGLHRLIAEEGVSEQVIFAGFVDEVEPYYADCDALLLTSCVEGLPMTVLEAMRAGRAAIATPVGGVAELILQDVTGWVLSGHAASELAEIIGRLNADRARLSAYGAAARKRFLSEFLVETQAEALAKILGIEHAAQGSATVSVK